MSSWARAAVMAVGVAVASAAVMPVTAAELPPALQSFGVSRAVSAFELSEIARFCAAMQLDWGGLDVLRERETGRLYVVDVNKTDTGPAVVLSWRDRIFATRLLANALTDMVPPSA